MPADPAAPPAASRFELGGRVVGAGRALVVAEIGQAHDGSLGLAHAFVDAVAEAGADAVKFQTHIAAAESSPGEPWRVRFSPQDATRYDYWRRMEFTEDQWLGLRRHADEKKLAFLSSPFSEEAVDLLARVGVAAWKVASGEAGNLPLLDHMASTRLPFLISTGMSPLAETDAAVARVRAAGLACAVLQCSSTYPCPPDKLGLNMLDVYRARYGCPVGLSDHSGTIYAALAAAALGCDLVEVHVTLSRQMFGPDVTSSVTTDELRTLVSGLRFIESVCAHPVDKDAAAREAEPMRRLFTKSVVARVDLPSGTILGSEHLTLRKPGTGIPPARLGEMAGRKLRHAVAGGTLLAWEDLE